MAATVAAKSKNDCVKKSAQWIWARRETESVRKCVCMCVENIAHAYTFLVENVFRLLLESRDRDVKYDVLHLNVQISVSFSNCRPNELMRREYLSIFWWHHTAPPQLSVRLYISMAQFSRYF